jgi:hypothetical protein
MSLGQAVVARSMLRTAAGALVIQGTFGVIQGTFHVIQGTFSAFQGTFVPREYVARSGSGG